MASSGTVGERIRTFREQKELDLAELARLTHLNQEFLQDLESGKHYPSIGPLQKIARALGTRLGTFIDDQPVCDPVICHLDPDLPNGDLSGRHEATNLHPSYIYQALGKGKADRNMEPFAITIYPQPFENLKSSSHQGEEFIFVLSGELLVKYGRKEYHLKPFSSIYYNSILPHCLTAKGPAPCQILAVAYNP